MLFNSPEFLFAFLPFVVAAFWILDRFATRAWAIAFLGMASIFFYGWWNYRLLWVLLASVAVNYLISRMILTAPRKAAFWWTAGGVTLNLAFLFHFKYTAFALGILSGSAGLDFSSVNIVLPIGISFFTFQQIAFLVDTYAGKCEERKFLPYLVFVTFFPQLIAGPIVHHKEMMPQFRTSGRGSPIVQNLAVGLTIFVIGLAKKVLLADTFAILASPVFNAASDGQVIAFWDAWVAALAYTLQIYFDFSGYSDMAIGIGRMFGVRLPVNFSSPYKAVSVVDFWRRWHITLSRFLRDYLYIPLGGNRKGRPRAYVNMAVTMVLGGLWHGASWTFVLWGAFHGAGLILTHLLRGRGTRPAIPRPVGWGLTLVFVVAAWVLFRADTLSAAGRIYAGMMGFNGIAVPPSWSPLIETYSSIAGMLGLFPGEVPLLRETRWLPLLAGYLLVLFAPNTQTLLRRHDPGLQSAGYPDPVEGGYPEWLHWSTGLVHATAVGLLLAFCIAKLNDVSEFIYFQF